MNSQPTPPTTARTSRTATPRQRALLFAMGLVLCVLALALVEATMAVFGIGDAHLYEDPFVGFEPGRELFSRRVLTNGDKVYATNPNKLAFFNYQEFPAAKAPETYRIFSLGGSTTAGRPYDDKVAFSKWLQLYLDEMDPSRTYEVINAGAISYASYRIVVLMKELVGYEPDLFVVYTGHNEFLEERTYSDIIHQGPALKKLRLWLNDLRSYTLARYGWRQLRGRQETLPGILEGEVTTRLDGRSGLDLYRRDDGLKRSVVEHFEYNLQQMAAIARRAGADLVFVKPASNLKDFSPFKSERARGLEASEITVFEARYSQGRALLESGDPRGALAIFEEARRVDGDFADLHFRIGQCYLASGDYAAARAAFIRAKDLDIAPLRALEPMSELVATVARRYELALIDLPAVLEAACQKKHGHSIVGNEYFLDHVHPHIPVHSQIAERVIAALLENGVVRPDPSWSDARRQAIYDRQMASLDSRYYAQRDLNLAKVLGWAGKLEEAEPPLQRAALVLADEPEVHLNLGIIYQRTGRWAQALEELRKALQLTPDSAAAYFNLGVVLGRLNRLEEGIEALEESIRLRPDYVEAYHNLGILYRRNRQPDRAAASFQRALRLQPDAAEIHSNLGLAYRQQGRLEAAVESFRRSLELDPVDVGTRTDLGITLARQGRLNEAAAELERAVEIEPSHADAHYNLGVVYARQGEPERAVAAYHRALEADPAHAEAHNNLGIYYAGRGELQEASHHLLLAIEGDRDYAEAYFNLGVVYDNASQPQAALQAIEQAVRLDADNPRFHYALATLLYARGELARSLPHFEKAREGGQTIPPEVLEELRAQRSP